MLADQWSAARHHPTADPLIAFDVRRARVLVLVLARGMGASGDRRRSALLQSVYGMTTAETEIAFQLAQGKLPEAIAIQRRKEQTSQGVGVQNSATPLPPTRQRERLPGPQLHR